MNAFKTRLTLVAACLGLLLCVALPSPAQSYESDAAPWSGYRWQIRRASCRETV